MFKIKSVLRSDEKDMVSEFESKIMVRGSEELNDHLAPNALASVFRAIGEKKQLDLLYETLSSHEPESRIIEPVGVYHESGKWYIFGYCHLRSDYRQFRTDRIHKIQLTALSFSKSHGQLESYLQPNSGEKTKIRILVDKDIVRYIKSDRKNYGFVSEKHTADGCEMTFLCRDPRDMFGRWFMMFADYATILEPDWLNDTILGYMNQARERIKKRPQG
ncbi:MAG: WYL domain-containing protein [Proteobacteria bacterium]|nr:MAG: WYL domain-containing protein [Pseudomonadota bacterium]